MSTSRFILEKGPVQKTDTILLMTLVFLVGLGLAVLFSASFFKAGLLSPTPWYFVIRQMGYVLFGGVVAFFLSRISWETVRKAVPWLLLVSFILMLAVFLPFWDRESILGARRWIIKFGYSFQPSELVKPVVVIYLASMFAKKDGHLDDVKRSLLPPFAVSFTFVFLALLQNDYSTSMFLLFVILVMFFLAGVKLRYFLVVLAVAVVLGIYGVATAPYRMERILTFIDPSRDPTGASFQINSSRLALADGGFWGTGFGGGTHKLGGIPEVYNDFIFAVVGEETGFWGVILIFALFATLAWRGFISSLRQKDAFPKMLGIGLTTFLVYQALLNTAVVVGVVPATGVTLPFFSYGGSSILISLAMGGLLLNLSRTGGNHL